MNKILVKHDKIEDTNLVDFNDNSITFTKNGDYIVEYIDCNNINLTIKILDDVSINLYVVSSDNNIVSNIKYVLNKNSYLNVNKFYNNTSVRENININLDGYYSSINYKFSGITRGEEVYNMKIFHNNSNTNSIVSNHLIANVDSKIDFSIDSKVLSSSNSCSMNQDTRIINIGDNKSVIRPNMFIDNYDVEAKHSSVIGKFREEDIFYMLSRGIDYNTAFKLLVKGYIFSNMDKFMFMRAYVLNVINEYWR